MTAGKKKDVQGYRDRNSSGLGHQHITYRGGAATGPLVCACILQAAREEQESNVTISADTFCWIMR